MKDSVTIQKEKKNPTDLLLKVETEHTIRLVKNEVLERAEREPSRVLEVIHEPTWRRDNNVRSPREHNGLGDHIDP
jgi:hypothetical protein